MPENTPYQGESKQAFQDRMSKKEDKNYIAKPEDIEGHKEYLFGVDLYNGPMNSKNTEEYQQAAALSYALDERGFNDKKKMQYGYGLKTGQPVDLMFTGEFKYWEEFGDNYREQMPAEDFEELYGQPRKSTVDRLKGAVKEIDIVQKLMNKFGKLK